MYTALNATHLAHLEANTTDFDTCSAFLEANLAQFDTSPAYIGANSAHLKMNSAYIAGKGRLRWQKHTSLGKADLETNLTKA